jgi:phospholipid-transporting ATPase
MNNSHDISTNRIIEKKTNNLDAFDPETQINVYFGQEAYEKNMNYIFKDNTISTTKYNIFTWIPKSLFMQFTRAANIYFLIICILTLMYFSPKSPISMIGTFAAVLIATMIKEGIEVN